MSEFDIIKKTCSLFIILNEEQTKKLYFHYYNFSWNNNSINDINNLFKEEINIYLKEINYPQKIDVDLYKKITQYFLSFLFKSYLKEITTQPHFRSEKMSKLELKIILFHLYSSFFEQRLKMNFKDMVVKKYYVDFKRIINTCLIQKFIKFENNNTFLYIFKEYKLDVPKLLSALLGYLEHFNKKNFSLEEKLQIFSEIIKNTDDNLKLNALDLNEMKMKGHKWLLKEDISPEQDSNLKESIIFYFIPNYEFKYQNINNVYVIFEIMIGYYSNKNPRILETIFNDCKKKIGCSILDNDISEQFKKYKINNQGKSIFNEYSIPKIEEDLDLSPIPREVLNKINKLNENTIYSEGKQIVVDFFETIFEKEINIFLQNNYKNNFNQKNLEKLFYYWKEMCFQQKNVGQLILISTFIVMNYTWKELNKNVIKKMIYKIIYFFEMEYSKSSWLNQEQCDDFYTYLDSNNYEVIQNCYDKKKLNDLIQKKFKKYTMFNFKNIDPIVFVDNNMLSASNRYIFSKYEQEGDKLYKFVIHLLMLEGKIICDGNGVEYTTNQFQIELINSLSLEQIIQRNNVYFGNFNSYQLSDYFESLLASLYRTHNFDIEKLKEFIYLLFKENKKNQLSNFWQEKDFYNGQNFRCLLKIPNVFLDYDTRNEIDKNSIYYNLITSYIEYIFIKEYKYKKPSLFKQSYWINLNIHEFYPEPDIKKGIFWILYSYITNNFQEFETITREWIDTQINKLTKL